MVVGASPTLGTQTMRWGSGGKSFVGSTGTMFALVEMVSLAPDWSHLTISRMSASVPVVAPTHAAISVALTSHY